MPSVLQTGLKYVACAAWILVCLSRVTAELMAGLTHTGRAAFLHLPALTPDIAFTGCSETQAAWRCTFQALAYCKAWLDNSTDC